MDHHLAPQPRRFVTGLATAVVAAAAGLAVAGFTGGGPGHATAHDRMRKLWEDHIVWTRMTIVSFAEGNADLQPTLDRLLRNQDDIGDAVKPFYGRKAGKQLTALLEEHINGAVDLPAPDARHRRGKERQRGRRLPTSRQPAELAARRDALDDAHPSRPDPGRGGGPDRRRLRRGHPRLRSDPPAHPEDGRRAERRDRRPVFRALLARVRKRPPAVPGGRLSFAWQRTRTESYIEPREALEAAGLRE